MLGIGAAVAAIMWAYDGWGNVTVVAEEIHNPQRNLPLGLIVGVLLLIALYTGANLAYHLTLPSSVIAAPDNVCPAIPRLRAAVAQLRRQADAGDDHGLGVRRAQRQRAGRPARAVRRGARP